MQLAQPGKSTQLGALAETYTTPKTATTPKTGKPEVVVW